jgi:hypothetical protein
MTDRDLELQLRAWYGLNVPVTESAPPTLRSVVLAIPRTGPRPLVPLERRRTLVLVAAALVVLAVAGAILVGGFPFPTVKPSLTPDVPSPRPSAAQTIVPSPLPSLPIAGMVSDWRRCSPRRTPWPGS